MELSKKEIKEKHYSAQNWVSELICGKKIKEVFLAQGSDGWKENENKLAPEASCILVFDDGSEINFQSRNLNTYLGIIYSSDEKV